MGFSVSFDLGVLIMMSSSEALEQFRPVEIRDDLSWSYMKIYDIKNDYKGASPNLKPAIHAWMQAQNRLYASSAVSGALMKAS